MAAMQLRPAPQVYSSSKSSFGGLTTSFQRLSVVRQPVARSGLNVQGECMVDRQRCSPPAR
jgi:hypothetical protein